MTVDHHGALDLAIFRAVNSAGGQALDGFFLALSSRWFGLVAGCLLVALILARGGRRRLELLVVLGLAVGLSDFLGAQVLRPLIGRMRPCYALPPGTFRWVGGAANVGSLPSLHASNFFAAATVAWAAGRRTGLVAVVVAALVALSRVYLGVHWPSDVLAGVVWGSCCALAVLQVGRRLRNYLLRGLPATRDLEQLQARVRAWAAGREDVRAVLLVGSHARRRARPDSDVDLVILTDRPERYLDDPHFAAAFGPVARSTVERWGKLTSIRAWFKDGLEIEFGFATADWITAEPLDAGSARVLSDGASVVLDRIGGLEERIRSLAQAAETT